MSINEIEYTNMVNMYNLIVDFINESEVDLQITIKYVPYVPGDRPGKIKPVTRTSYPATNYTLPTTD